MKKLSVEIVLCVSILFFTTGVGAADSVTFELEKTSDYFRTDFPTSEAPFGYMMIWSGNVKFNGDVIGEFNARLTKTTETGSSGAIQSYDIVIPKSDPAAIGNFLCVKTAHITTGAGSDIGIIYATSPDFKVLINATVTITGNVMTIEW